MNTNVDSVKGNDSLYVKWILVFGGVTAVAAMAVGLTHKHWMGSGLMTGESGDYTLGQWMALQSYIYLGFIVVVASMFYVRIAAVSPLSKAVRNFLLLCGLLFYAVAAALLLVTASPWGFQNQKGGANWDFVVTCPAFLVCLSLVVMTLKPLLGNIIKTSKTSVEKAPLLTSKSNYESCGVKKSTQLLLFSLLFLPLMLFLCMLLPPMWSYMNDLAAYSGVDQSGAYSFTINRLHLNLFPDVLMYYTFLYTITILGVIVQYSKTAFRISHTRISVLGNASVGSIVLLFCFISLITSFTNYWARHKYYNSDVSTVENVARTSGQVASLFMALLLLPLPRSSIWGSVFGVSWEAGLVVHTWLGYLVFLFSFLHQILFYFRTKDFPNIWDYHFNNFTVPSMLTAWWLAFFLILILSVNTIRRNRFEIFYFAHHFGMIFIFICLLHAGSCWFYIVGGLSLWFFDRAIRFSSGTKRTTVLSATAHGENDFAHTELVLSIPGFSYKRGQFCFINIPEISMFEWHPFTVSSAPHEDEVTFHIKAMLPPRDAADSIIKNSSETWTTKLHKLSSSNLPMVVSVDGAYGTPPDYSRYSHVIFCVGGIGVTPAHNTVKSFIHDRMVDSDSNQPNIHTIWSIRHGSLIDMMDGSFTRLPPLSSLNTITSSIFLTANHDTSPGYPNVQCCSISEQAASCEYEFKSIASKVDSSRDVLVFTCGPPPFTNAMFKLAVDNGFDYHTETFAL